jgi:hypothetical protein
VATILDVADNVAMASIKSAIEFLSYFDRICELREGSLVETEERMRA